MGSLLIIEENPQIFNTILTPHTPYVRGKQSQIISTYYPGLNRPKFDLVVPNLKDRIGLELIISAKGVVQADDLRWL